ncbi:MAG: DUF4421 family protein [Bacteroidaceae bacterium]|nr:DUF4421 family protein [Bacteroidaceae bacterium]
MKRHIFVYFTLLMSLHAVADEPQTPPQRDRFKEFWGRVDKWLCDRYYNVSVDTNYIARPQTRWTVTVPYNLTGATVYTRGTMGGEEMRMRSAYKCKNTIGLAGSYTGISLALTYNPSSFFGWYNDLEYNTTEYYNRMGFDFVVHRAKNVRGWTQVGDGPKTEIGKKNISQRSFNFNYYYAFNYKKFSYPAAFCQSYIQKRSAGSFMLGASFQWQKLHSAGDATIGNEVVKLKAANIGIGAGYGYNFVIRKNWLLHLSTLPTFIVYSRARLWTGDGIQTMPYHFPEFIMTGSAALIRNFGRYFAGGTMHINYTLIGRREQLQVGNSKWRTHFFIGFRF